MKQAPIETMFLPYYVSQSVGWVYLRKSFSSLDFYKNFKEDYLDYYLGTETSTDRVEQHRLQTELKDLSTKINLLSQYDQKNEALQLARLADEEFQEQSNNYLSTYTEKFAELTDKENELVIKSNELSYLRERKSVLSRISRNQKSQKPENGNCPTCSQVLPFGIAEIYTFLQEENDTNSELELVKIKLRETQSRVNSLEKAISEQREKISANYSILQKHLNSGVSFERWLKNKTNIELSRQIESTIGNLTISSENIREQLKNFKTDSEREKTRESKNQTFMTIFLSFLHELSIKIPKEDRYKKIYQISTFPSQGVELLLTTLAYHFAFNRVISQTENLHRFPFMLDAIFKEDIEEDNREMILSFVRNHAPSDTQVILSIAQSRGQVNNAQKYNNEIFKGNAKLIQIGDGTQQRTFLTPFSSNQMEIFEDSQNIMNEV